MATPKEQHDARPQAITTGSTPRRAPQPGAAHTPGISPEAPASDAARPEPGAPEHGGTPAPPAEPTNSASEEP